MTFTHSNEGYNDRWMGVKRKSFYLSGHQYRTCVCVCVQQRWVFGRQDKASVMHATIVLRSCVNAEPQSCVSVGPQSCVNVGPRSCVNVGPRSCVSVGPSVLML